VKRTQIETEIRAALSQNPGVILLGPKLCGKTTLAKGLGQIYFDLENPQDQQRLEHNWLKLIASEQTIVLDQAQFYPDLFPKLILAIDQQRERNGRFVIVGLDSSPSMLQLSQSLAGRLSRWEIPPFSIYRNGR
jgi:predicted AAA+ superfamily ATPase